MAGKLVCHSCSADLELEDPIGRSARCPRCNSDVRCCLNCRFHDLSSYNDCAEPSAERVLEKDRANFCDYFSPSSAARSVGAPAASAGDGLSELEKLFRK
jgi:hypothetical protein